MRNSRWWIDSSGAQAGDRIRIGGMPYWFQVEDADDTEFLRVTGRWAHPLVVHRMAVVEIEKGVQRGNEVRA